MRDKHSLISASEVGDYVFCALAWRLRAEGHEAAALQAAREAGSLWHHEHGRDVRRSRQWIIAAKALTALAVALSLLFVLYLVLC